MGEVKYSDLFSEQFDGCFEDILDHGHDIYTLPGGRGSGKSAFVGTVVPLLMVLNPGVHAICFRKYAYTLERSCYADITNGIERLGLTDRFKFKKSPMEITYKPTGQTILFRGMDDPSKIKSIKIPSGYIGIQWFEEMAEMPARKELRTVTQSVARGGDKIWRFESFNPPITRAAWVNEDLEKRLKRRLITWSDYLHMPAEWLGDTFIQDAEDLKEQDERAYRHEYLGEAIGTGGNVFERVEARKIPDEWIKRFDRIYQGLDFGWFPDPAAFVRLSYDASRRTIYIIDELYVNKWSNEQLAYWVKGKGYADITTICDSAEMKSIADLSRMGMKTDACYKSNLWIRYGMKWLQARKIIVDPMRCPHTWKELRDYEYERDKNGELVNGYPDANNHTIDAIRYSLDRLLLSSRSAQKSMMKTG